MSVCTFVLYTVSKLLTACRHQFIFLRERLYCHSGL